MTRLFTGCSAYYAGILQDAGSNYVMMDLDGTDVFSVVVQPISGTFATAAIKVRYANDQAGPWADFGTPITLNTTTRGSGLVGVIGRYIALDVTTPEGGSCLVDVAINAKRSELPVAVRT